LVQSFNALFHAKRFDGEEGDGFTLIWSRSRRPRGEQERHQSPARMTRRPSFGGRLRSWVQQTAQRRSQPSCLVQFSLLATARRISANWAWPRAWTIARPNPPCRTQLGLPRTRLQAPLRRSVLECL